MKKLVIFFLLLFNICMTSIARMHDTTGTVRPWSNTPGYNFPRHDKGNKAIFRLKISNAKKVQVDIGGMNDGVTGADSFWTVITKLPGVGFHYYFSVIDGVWVADPVLDTQ